MVTPGVSVVRAVAAVSLLVLVAGLLSAAPVAGAAGRGPLLRLEKAGDSVVSAVDVPLSPSLHSSASGARRTPRFDTTGHSMVALTWRGQAPELRVRSRSGGAWTAWMPAEPLTDLPDEATGEGGGVRGSQPVWVGPSDGVQVAARGPVPDDLALVLIDPGALRDGDGTAEVGTTAPRVGSARVGTTAPQPELRSRRAWGADEGWRDGGPWYNRTLKQVHVHHTVTGNAYSRAEVPGLIRGMYRYHTQNLDWSDLGYNFLVDRFGRTWVGRAGGPKRRVRGAHTLGFNHSSTGVAVIGNFESQGVPRAAFRALVRLSAWKLDLHGRDPSGRVRVRSRGSDRYPSGTRVRLPVIDGHRDTNHTACPGQSLYDRLPALRRRAQNRVDRF